MTKNAILKNLIKDGDEYYFKGENCWFIKEDGNGEYDVYDDGEWEGKYCGSLEMLEEMNSGSEALDYVIAGL